MGIFHRSMSGRVCLSSLMCSSPRLFSDILQPARPATRGASRCLTHRPPQRGRSSDDVVTPGSGRPHGREGKFWYQGSSCLPYLTWSPSRLHIQPLTIVVMHIEFAKYIMSNSTSRKPPSIMNSYCGGIAPSRDAALSHAFDRRRGGIHCKALNRHWEARWLAGSQLDSPNSGPALLSSEYSEISYSTSSQSIALDKQHIISDRNIPILH